MQVGTLNFVRIFVLVYTLSIGPACVLTSDQEPTSDQTKSLIDLLPRTQPIEPEDALKTFQIEEGFHLELVASEPEVTDPAAIAFDENGRMYVAELRDYPYYPPEGQLPSGRVRLLEDSNSDGRYEKSWIFSDHVQSPSGIAPWKGGVFVAAPPEILYLKDTDGDNVADIRRVVFTGFGTERIENTMNNLEWGLDHLIYGASSSNAGEVRPSGEPRAEGIPLRSRDFRFDPVSGQFELQAGTGDFGNGFDDWGNRFVCNAGTVIMHAVLPNRYLARNPYLVAPRGLKNLLKSEGRGRVYPISAPEPWRTVRQTFWDRWVNTTHHMRASRFPSSELAPQGFVTGAAGVKIYRGLAYPQPYRGNAFTGEVAGNLVIRTVLHPDGASFRAERASTEKEFLASTDNWFRPVNFANAADGCLYVLDMYRETIEDPTAIPEDILQHLDVYSGQDRGRIYRIVPDGFRLPEPPRLGKATTAKLTAILEHPDAWWRETAHRLLFERQDKSAAKALKRLSRTSDVPQARLHALWSLEGLGELDEATLLLALKDAHPAIREHAVRLAEGRLKTSVNLCERVLALAEDPDPRVRFQTAFSLSVVDQQKAVDALWQIARRDAADEWSRTAILCAVPTRAATLLKTLIADPQFFNQLGAAVLLRELAALVGARNDLREVSSLLATTLDQALSEDPQLRRDIMLGLAEGSSRAGRSLRTLLEDPALDLESIRDGLNTLFEESAQVARDTDRPPDTRLSAIQLMGFAPG